MLRKLMKRVFKAMILLFVLFGGSACNSDFWDFIGADQSDTIRLVNKFIDEDMTLYYLWTDEMPGLNYKKQTDPFAFFDSLLYTDDRWSFITDDYESLANSLKSTETTFGYSLAFGQFSNTNNYFAVIEYVNRYTPADKANLKRGDIIIGFNGESITSSNYKNLIYADKLTLQMGVYSILGISKGGEISLTSASVEMNPVLTQQVFDLNGKKVGYMVYNHYYASYLDSLDAALRYFQDQQISELVLDLRYNPGGDLSAAQHLCSAMAPDEVVLGKKKLVDKKWNSQLQEYWYENGQTSELVVNFDPTVPVRLGLKRLFVLTTGHTASASELTITGLDPYMEVVSIGETTSGKYTGSVTLRPKVKKNNEWVVDETISNWAMQPIVFKYSNSLGVTEFKDGLSPDYYVFDQLLPAWQLGDQNEPLLAKALEQISGETTLAVKSAGMEPRLPFIPRGRLFSRHQPFLENLIDDQLQPAR